MKPEVKLIEHSPNPEAAIVHAARVCYDSVGDADSYYNLSGMDKMKSGSNISVEVPKIEIRLGPNDKKLLRKLMTNNHSATLRFAYAHFHITNISRNCAFQLCRTAHAGILMRSMRYVDEYEQPMIFPNDDEWFRTELEKLRLASDNFYKEAIERGFKKEEARYGKLTASRTELHFSGNFQMFKHFLSIRLNKKVMMETRLVAAELCKSLYDVAPIVFEEDYNRLKDIF